LSSRSLSLLQAVTSKDEGAVKALLSEGADVNARNDSGQTPLILAIISGQDHLLKRLLEAGADPLLRDHTQLNAIEWAERKGRSDLAQILARTTQSRNPSTNNLNEKLVEAEKKTPPSLDELRNVRPLSSDEKSRKWLAGMKRRFEEKADRETTKDQSVSSQTNQSNIMRSGSTLPVLPVKVTPEISNSGPVIDEVTPEITTARLSTDDAIPEIFPQTIAEISSEPKHDVQLASKRPGKPSSSRKRCPQCNTLYNSELLAYCAYHTVRLVNADEPIVTTKANNSASVLWILVLITLSLAGVTGVFLSGYLYENKNRPGSSAPVVTKTRQGIPVLGSTLVGKSVNLPAADITPQTLQETATITVRVKIDRGGRVVAAASSEGDRLLREAATEAAKRSTFSVEKLRGRGAEGTITYTFNQ
jgi:hypothetical protein